MTLLGPLLGALALALAAVVVGWRVTRHAQGGRGESLLGFRLMMLGTENAAEHDAGSSHYRPSWGLAWTTTVGLAAGLWVICPQLPGEAGPGSNWPLRVDWLMLSGPYAWALFALFAAIALLYLRHLWGYKVEIDGTTLRYPAFGSRQPRRHDLTRLTRIEDGGRYALRLYFDNGDTGVVMKQVRGLEDMLTRLEAHLS